MDLQAIRNEIDGVDDQLLPLIARRIELSRDVAKCKLEQNRPVFNPGREVEIVERLRARAPKPYRDSVCAVYLQILGESKAIQRKLIAEWAGGGGGGVKKGGARVACRGGEGACPPEAALGLFPGAALSFEESFAGVFEKVAGSVCDYGIVPIESACAGSVTDNYDLLLQYDVSILKSLTLAPRGPLPEKGGGAAPRDTAKARGRDFTRFVLIGKKPPPGEGAITSIAVRLAHVPSALHRALGAFSKRGINMAGLRSRPVPGRPSEFMFYIDFEGGLRDGDVRAAISEIRGAAAFLKILGCYSELKS